VYLFTYHAGFGNGLSLFASPTDVFSVSLSDVAPGYIFALIGVALGYFALPSKKLEAATHAGGRSLAHFKIAIALAVIFCLLNFVLAAIMKSNKRRKPRHQTIDLLRQLKNNHRNPLMHAELVLSDKEALDLFSIGGTVMSALALEMR
jgi:hypothetical protein